MKTQINKFRSVCGILRRHNKDAIFQHFERDSLGRLGFQFPCGILRRHNKDATLQCFEEGARGKSGGFLAWQ